MSSSADAPDGVPPDPVAGQERDQEEPEGLEEQEGLEGSDGPEDPEAAAAAHPGGSEDDAVSPPAQRRHLVRNVAALAVVALAVAAAAVASVIAAFTGNSAPAKPAASAASASASAATSEGATNEGATSGAAAHGGTAGPAVLANEAAATVAVVKTSGSAIGGPVLGRDGRLWLVELSKSAVQPMLAAVNPVSYAVSTHPLPAVLDGLSLRYTGTEAFDNVGQLWLGARATPAAGQAAPAADQPAGVLVRYTPATGAVTWFSLAGICGGDPAARPAQLFTASDGGVWVECAADSGATAIARLSRDGVFTQPSIVNYLNRALQGTSLWDQIAGLPQANIGPLVPALAGAMWGVTANGFIQVTAAGAETFTPSDSYALELETQVWTTVRSLQLVGNGETESVEGLGECRPERAPAAQARECAVAVNLVGGKAMLAAPPDDDGQAGGPAVHPAGIDASGDVWFIVDGTAGGQAPQGQYFFEVDSGGGTRIIPFSVPGDALPIPAVQAPVITQNGAVWTADPEAGPGALVEVMPKN